jgi:hypothetical protein
LTIGRLSVLAIFGIVGGAIAARGTTRTPKHPAAADANAVASKKWLLRLVTTHFRTNPLPGTNWSRRSSATM